MSPHLQKNLQPAGDCGDGLAFVARNLARAAARHVPRPPKIRHATLRPGPDTPLWNALVLTVRCHLRRYGAKTKLGRELGVPPQRIHDYFVGRTAAPDAERTLERLLWLSRGKPPSRCTGAR